MYPQALLVLVTFFVTIGAQSPTSSCPIPDSVFLSVDTSPITDGCDTSNGATTEFCDNCICGVLTVFANAMVAESQYFGSNWCNQGYYDTLGMCLEDYVALLIQNGILTSTITNTLSNCSTNSTSLLGDANCTSAFNIWEDWYNNSCILNVSTTATPTPTPTPTSVSTGIPSIAPTSSCPIPSSSLLSVDTSPITNGCGDYSGGATSTFCSNCFCGIITVSVNASVVYMQSTGANLCSEDPTTIYGLCEDSFATFLIQNSIITFGTIDTLENCPYFNYTTCTDAINIWENWYDTNCNGGTQVPIANTTSTPTSTSTSTSTPTPKPSGAIEATLSFSSFALLIGMLIFDLF